MRCFRNELLTNLSFPNFLHKFFVIDNIWVVLQLCSLFNRFKWFTVVFTTYLMPISISKIYHIALVLFLKILEFPLLFYGTIMQTGTTCKKISCYMCDSACRWRIAENTKSYVKHFWNLPRVRNTKSRLVNASNFSSISQSYFLTETIKQSF